MGNCSRISTFPKTLLILSLNFTWYKIRDGRQKISFGLASKEEARHLRCKVGSPVLIVKRTTYVEGGLPINYAHAIYRGDRYEYIVNLQRHPSGLENRNDM
ncbi:MAG: GntR family transcriptional regulator [Bacillota bacterium]